MLKRGIIVVAAVAAVIVAGTLWLLARSHHSTYVTPEEAVLKTCHADPANPPHDYADRLPGGSGRRGGTPAAPSLAFVGWTAAGESTGPSETALVLRTTDRKWWVTDCRLDFSLHG